MGCVCMCVSVTLHVQYVSRSVPINKDQSLHCQPLPKGGIEWARQLYLYSTFHTQGSLRVLHIETA